MGCHSSVPQQKPGPLRPEHVRVARTSPRCAGTPREIIAAQPERGVGRPPCTRPTYACVDRVPATWVERRQGLGTEFAQRQHAFRHGSRRDRRMRARPVAWRPRRAVRRATGKRPHEDGAERLFRSSRPEPVPLDWRRALDGRTRTDEGGAAATSCRGRDRCGRQSAGRPRLASRGAVPQAAVGLGHGSAAGAASGVAGRGPAPASARARGSGAKRRRAAPRCPRCIRAATPRIPSRHSRRACDRWGGWR